MPFTIREDFEPLERLAHLYKVQVLLPDKTCAVSENAGVALKPAPVHITLSVEPPSPQSLTTISIPPVKIKKKKKKKKKKKSSRKKKKKKKKEGKIVIQKKRKVEDALPQHRTRVEEVRIKTGLSKVSGNQKRSVIKRLVTKTPPTRPMCKKQKLNRAESYNINYATTKNPTKNPTPSPRALDFENRMMWQDENEAESSDLKESETATDVTLSQTPKTDNGLIFRFIPNQDPTTDALMQFHSFISDLSRVDTYVGLSHDDLSTLITDYNSFAEREFQVDPDGIKKLSDIVAKVDINGANAVLSAKEGSQLSSLKSKTVERLNSLLLLAHRYNMPQWMENEDSADSSEYITKKRPEYQDEEIDDSSSDLGGEFLGD